MSTTMVESTKVLNFLSPLTFGSDSQGQLALRNSPFTSPRKPVILEIIMIRCLGLKARGLRSLVDGVAREVRLELTTNGFGDRYSTN